MDIIDEVSILRISEIDTIVFIRISILQSSRSSKIAPVRAKIIEGFLDLIPGKLAILVLVVSFEKIIKLLFCPRSLGMFVVDINPEVEVKRDQVDSHVVFC